MDDRHGERIARCEQVVRDLERRVSQLARELDILASRNRKTEWAVKLVVDEQKQARLAVERRQRRLELRVEVLTGVVACAALVATLLQAFPH